MKCSVVWCDVVLMDACHLLLGRPWQYDRRIVHDGFKNTYSFEKDGAKIILGPAKMEDISKPSRGVGGNLLSKSEFLGEMREQNETYILVVLEANKDNLEVPHLLQTLFHDFQDVIADTIPAGLPPMRSIQHCIDFAPGAVILNKAAYRMNPKEFEEL